MKDCIIINKTALEKRIEELEKEVEFYNKVSALSINPNRIKAETKLSLLKQILSQSTPLIPEIEKAIQFGKDIRSEKSFINPNFDSPFVDYEDSTEETARYISYLKLDV